MSKTVECFYTLSSPWMYLGGKQLSDIIKRHGANLVLRPYDFRLVVPHAGGIALRTRPDYWAARGGMDGFFIARFVKG